MFAILYHKIKSYGNIFLKNPFLVTRAQIDKVGSTIRQVIRPFCFNF